MKVVHQGSGFALYIPTHPSLANTSRGWVYSPPPPPPPPPPCSQTATSHHNSHLTPPPPTGHLTSPHPPPPCATSPAPLSATGLVKQKKCSPATLFLFFFSPTFPCPCPRKPVRGGFRCGLFFLFCFCFFFFFSFLGSINARTS